MINRQDDQPESGCEEGGQQDKQAAQKALREYLLERYCEWLMAVYERAIELGSAKEV